MIILKINLMILNKFSLMIEEIQLPILRHPFLTSAESTPQEVSCCTSEPEWRRKAGTTSSTTINYGFYTKEQLEEYYGDLIGDIGNKLCVVQ